MIHEMQPHPEFARNDKEWHQLVCIRDGFTCQYDQKNFNYPCYFDERGINQAVCGHHIKGKKAHPELRLKVSNGICLCDLHHRQLHAGMIKLKS